MDAIIATGTMPIRPRPATMDFTPLITVLVALVAVRVVFGVRLRWPVVAVVVALGTPLGWAIDAYGVVVPTAVAFAAALILTTPLHRRARPGPSSA